MSHLQHREFRPFLRSNWVFSRKSPLGVGNHRRHGNFPSLWEGFRDNPPLGFARIHQDEARPGTTVETKGVGVSSGGKMEFKVVGFGTSARQSEKLRILKAQLCELPRPVLPVLRTCWVDLICRFSGKGAPSD